MLRKRIVKHWKSLKAGAQTQIKATLLESMMQEPEKVVRHAVAALAAALAKALVPKKAWPELFVFINQCAASAESAPHRELAYYLLHALAESIGTNLTAHLGARRAPRAARRAPRAAHPAALARRPLFGARLRSGHCTSIDLTQIFVARGDSLHRRR